MTEPLEQRIVRFYDDELVAVQHFVGAIYVVFPRLCDNLNLKRSAQVRRIQNHTVLKEGFITLTIQTQGGPQETQCLRLDLLPLWLSGLQIKRVKEELQPKLERYQREAAAVLWEAFKPQILKEEETAVDQAHSDVAIQELQRIVEMGEAMAQMARQQIELQRQQDMLGQRLDKAGQIVRGIQIDIADIQVRLGTVEDKLHPHAYITDEQAANVSNVVKGLAELLTQQKGKNQYQSVFSELYRRFGVPGYKHIRQEQYADVLAFLDDWRDAAMKGQEQQEGAADE
jgi:hypothetical protein